MRTILFVGFLLISMGLVSVCAQKAPDKITERNVKDFENGAVYDRKLDFYHRDAKVLEYAQEFLWNAWENRRQVAFKFYDYNREGDQIQNEFFVEKTPSGQWQVARVSKIISCRDYNLPRKCVEMPGRLENVYDGLEWEKQVFRTIDKVINTDIKILVLSNSKTKEKFEFSRGVLF